MSNTRFYIYAYAYPDGRVFYIGKGTGDRIGAHEADARAGVQSQKCEIIREIWARGQQVTKVKLAFFDDEIEALKYEASLISSLDGLANVVQGRKRIKDILLLQEDATYFGASIRQVDEDGENSTVHVRHVISLAIFPGRLSTRHSHEPRWRWKNRAVTSPNTLYLSLR